MCKRSILSVLSVTVFLLLAAVPGFAEEAKAPALAKLEEIKNALGMSIYLQGGYTYNFNDPGSRENGLRVFDHKDNSFTLDLAQLVFAKEAPMGGLGFKLKLSAGETAKFIHAAGLGDSDDPFDLTEAYLEYVAPLGKGLKFRFGKFVTMHGAEVIEAKDDMNYSRGLLFNFAIPFTHTGLMVGYPFSDKFGVNFYVVNGWDNFEDEGSSKTLGLSMNVTPSEQVAFVLNLMHGREADLQTGVESPRFLADLVATFKPVKNLTLALNGDYGVQQDSAPDGSDAKWYGIAGYVKYDFSDLFGLAMRAEYFKDPDGARTLTPQTAKEVTVTPEFRILKNLIIRPEYRHDWSDRRVFDAHDRDADRKKQDTVAIGVMYTW